MCYAPSRAATWRHDAASFGPRRAPRRPIATPLAPPPPTAANRPSPQRALPIRRRLPDDLSRRSRVGLEPRCPCRWRRRRAADDAFLGGVRGEPHDRSSVATLPPVLRLRPPPSMQPAAAAIVVTRAAGRSQPRRRPSVCQAVTSPRARAAVMHAPAAALSPDPRHACRSALRAGRRRPAVVAPRHPQPVRIAVRADVLASRSQADPPPSPAPPVAALDDVVIAAVVAIPRQIGATWKVSRRPAAPCELVPLACSASARRATRPASRNDPLLAERVPSFEHSLLVLLQIGLRGPSDAAELRVGRPRSTASRPVAPLLGAGRRALTPLADLRGCERRPKVRPQPPMNAASMLPRRRFSSPRRRDRASGQRCRLPDVPIASARATPTATACLRRHARTSPQRRAPPSAPVATPCRRPRRRPASAAPLLAPPSPPPAPLGATPPSTRRS